MSSDTEGLIKGEMQLVAGFYIPFQTQGGGFPRSLGFKYTNHRAIIMRGHSFEKKLPLVKGTLEGVKCTGLRLCKCE